MINFRELARTQLAKAKKLMDSGDNDELEAAALKLRKVMEALTYERSKIYEDDLGPKAMKTWQPRKLMERMLEVDPYADKAATVRIGEEPSLGQKPKTMRLIGTDHVLDMGALKKHYDALGAYLHTETLDQLSKGKAHNWSKLRKRCEDIVKSVQTVLDSHVWNSSIANRGQIKCHECGSEVRRRIGRDGSTRVIECWECKATYTMSLTDDNKVLFEPRMTDIHCPRKECEGSFPLWEKEFEPGSNWVCRSCGTKQGIALGVMIFEENPPPSSENES